MKNNVYPCKPQFYYIKVGFKGVKIICVMLSASSSLKLYKSRTDCSFKTGGELKVDHESLAVTTQLWLEGYLEKKK